MISKYLFFPRFPYSISRLLVSHTMILVLFLFFFPFLFLPLFLFRMTVRGWFRVSLRAAVSIQSSLDQLVIDGGGLWYGLSSVFSFSFLFFSCSVLFAFCWSTGRPHLRLMADTEV
ncbi:hypothetical protein M440DRAFT_203185 [Trichoderma longibrachiatum ATCC 18648]|uniref:Transmembrane protein n=1 Tax=Trichoderma longibrachiatum ATCC 18648 TaxID=983965 RepID=A0A2T4CGS3_TRILO|nr:hypothetical protein M440DRAFT_203185 [Trichoderma longibrachiatum ATCC 18648]